MASTFDIASQNSLGILNGNSVYPSISADGNLVAFESLTGALYQDYVKNEQTSTLTIVSQSSSAVTGNASSFNPAISADGSSVTFESTSTNLVAGASAGNDEIYVKNLLTGGLVLASQTAGGTVATGTSDFPAISANGSIVAFASNASNLGLGATGAFAEIYVKNVTTGALTLVSQTSTGTIANSGGFADSISPDGNIVLFEDSATDLGSTNGFSQIYVKNVATGALSIASEASDGTIGNASSIDGSVSSDGSTAVFDSAATNLVPGATSGNQEVYAKNLQTGAIALVSQSAAGVIANGSSSKPVASVDGKYVIFQSTATNLVAGATSGVQQVYVKNLQTGAITLLSKDATGAPGNNDSFTPYGNAQAFSADETKTAFETTATNLANTPAGVDVVLRDTTSGPALVLGPVTADNIVNTAELAAPVTFSGNADAVGGTVQVSIDTAANSIGTAIVAPDGTWSLSAAVSGLAPGAHTVIATAQGSAYLSTTATQGFQVDTTAPTVGFTPDVIFSHAHTATLTGTVSDPLSAVTGVEVFDNGTALGAATLNGDGTWTLGGVSLPHGVQSLTATATDAVGNTSAQTPSLYTLQTGIAGQPYTVDEEDFNAAGQLTGEVFTKKGGAVYLTDTVTNLPNGDIDIDTSAGTYFDTQTFYNKDDLYGPSYGLKVETLFNDDGTTSVTGYMNGQTLNSKLDDTMTGGGNHETFVFHPHFGQDIVTDFKVGGPGHDILSLPSAQFSSIGQVLAHTQDVGNDAVIHVGPHETITLDNVTTAQLQANHQDFKFHA